MRIHHGFIKELFYNNEFIISNHARTRMFQRNISTNDIRYIIENGEIIEDYLDDEPCPSALFLGLLKTKPIHIVIAQCEDHARIITVYIPDKDKWIDYRIRKDKV
ncbi:MAG TPA: DUF4258 domain-containing protein [Candidatus Nanoarchaeia archaeon]|nr:DUF4258 domain-containing protein [Candidatus Nanoarchaeia archaeon]